MFTEILTSLDLKYGFKRKTWESRPLLGGYVFFFFFFSCWLPAVYEIGKALPKKSGDTPRPFYSLQRKAHINSSCQVPRVSLSLPPHIWAGERVSGKNMPSGWIIAFSSSSFSSPGPLVPVSRLGLVHKEQVTLEAYDLIGWIITKRVQSHRPRNFKTLDLIAPPFLESSLSNHLSLGQCHLFLEHRPCRL